MNLLSTSAKSELIARAPLRISLAGGGTDLPAYYEQFGGMVISTTINRYVYVHCGANGKRSRGDVQIASADLQLFYRHHRGEPMRWDGELALPRAVLHSFEVGENLSLFLASQVPPGTGLGSSSAIAVALVRAVSAYLMRSLSQQQVAEMACDVEINKLSAPIGKQDQYASAFGGLNAITFSKDQVQVEPVRVSAATLRKLEQRLLLFFTGTARDSATILKSQQLASAQGAAQTVEGLHRIKAAAAACRTYLETGDLDAVGSLLDEGWQYKRSLVAGISNPRIDSLYDTALRNGAIGGKITGAGGGGFLLLYCREARQQELTDAMESLGLRRMDFRFEKDGATVSRVKWNGHSS